MTRKFFETVNTSDLSWSLDSATPETHIKIRRLDAFDLVVKNLRRWIAIREEYGGKKKHKVCVYNNINMFNVHEMTKMVELSHNIGVDKMIMLPTYDQSGVVQLGEMLMCEKNLDIFKKSSEEAMMRSQELGVKLYYSKKFDELPPPVGDSRPTTPEHPHEANLVQLDLNP
jgi:MoaA/NifB/PqqE/SkfB family radical SAM enzyme